MHYKTNHFTKLKTKLNKFLKFLFNQSLINQETAYHPDQGLSINHLGFQNICKLFLSFQPLLAHRRKAGRVSHPNKGPQLFHRKALFLIFVVLRQN
jgi:hypothetical protein